MRKLEKSLLIIISAILMIFLIIFNIIKNGNYIKRLNNENIELVWYTIGIEPDDMDRVEREVNNYLTKKINATIDIRFVDYADFTKVMNNKTEEGENFDLVFTSSWANDYYPNAKEGDFLNLNNLIKEYGKDVYKALDKKFWGAAIDGCIYAIPNQKEISSMPMWVFSKEYVEKYNIPYKDIKTLEDLEPWLKLIKENEEGVIPFYVDDSYSVPMIWDQLAPALGINLESNNFQVVNIFKTEEMINNLKTMRRYKELGYTNTKIGNAGDFSTKRFVTKADGQPYAEKIWSIKSGGEVVATPILESYITNGSVNGSMIAISKNSKNPEKAMEFLNLLNTDKYLRNLINYGIEGVHYEKISNNKIRLLEESKNYMVDYYTLGNLFITYVLEDEPENKWDEFKEVNNKSNVSQALGFKFDHSKVSIELKDVNTVLEEFTRSLYTGLVDTDEYVSKLINKLESAGIDKVKEELERQLNDWKIKKQTF
ncbi:ABC transporter substrate-binding protein [Clostridium perfringens]|uniref:ABC transporter substrate-binding protein n=1 Tax=Clostridium perfringens TaxID=1502 RepID=UPI00293F7D38|nr:ABC transporter substrate-binding protein [Clostridium perfringens]MDV5111528.1 ABC transporter substrate-binding protein [Clostridium perfringens]